MAEDAQRAREAGASKPRRESMPEISKRLVVEYGIELDGVWLPLAMLRRLDEHGRWNVPFAEATPDQARVLVAHGLAETHNNGLCRGNGLRNFVDAFPFEPTMPFRKIQSAANDAQPADRVRLSEQAEDSASSP
jgi:hypothetical protein